MTTRKVTRDHIPPCFLFCLDMAGVTDEFIKEANKQNCYFRREAHETYNFMEFVEKSFHWHRTARNFFGWLAIANQE